jgi:GH25 family lysozyme M1 (1,4-beta-N-acetylmuramidase)
MEARGGLMMPGVDVSWWQGLIDWQICRDAGARFAFIRAGSCNSVSGANYEDNLFRENVEGAFEANMPFGCYWYFRPNFSPTSQAIYFSELIGPENWVLPPVMDLESAPSGMTPDQVADAAEEFITQVYANLTVWPLNYSRGYWWNEHVNYRLVFAECDLWIARYTSLPEPWGNDGDSDLLQPEGWNDWKFWQHTDQGDAEMYGGPGPPSGDDDIDLNWFNGTEDEFLLYLGAPPPLPKRVKVVYQRNAILRATPEREGMYETIAMVGEELAVIDKAIDSDDREWYQTAGGLWVAVNQVESI